MWTQIERIQANQNDATVFADGSDGFALIAYVREFGGISRYRLEGIASHSEAVSIAHKFVVGFTEGYSKFNTRNSY